MPLTARGRRRQSPWTSGRDELLIQRDDLNEARELAGTGPVRQRIPSRRHRRRDVVIDERQGHLDEQPRRAAVDRYGKGAGAAADDGAGQHQPASVGGPRDHPVQTATAKAGVQPCRCVVDQLAFGGTGRGHDIQAAPDVVLAHEGDQVGTGRPDRRQVAAGGPGEPDRPFHPDLLDIDTLVSDIVAFPREREPGRVGREREVVLVALERGQRNDVCGSSAAGELLQTLDTSAIMAHAMTPSTIAPRRLSPVRAASATGASSRSRRLSAISRCTDVRIRLAPIGLPLQATREEAPDAPRDGARQRRVVRHAVEDAAYRFADIGTGERRPAREHLVQDAAEGPYVTPLIGGPSHDLLGAHVWRGPGDRRAADRIEAADVNSRRLTRNGRARPKSRTLTAPRGRSSRWPA